jgi:hypothetical protein
LRGRLEDGMALMRWWKKADRSQIERSCYFYRKRKAAWAARGLSKAICLEVTP